MARAGKHAPAIAAPDLLRRWQTWAFGLAVMLIPFFVPIPIALRRDPIISPLGDQLHIPLLAGIALFIYWRGPLAGRLGATALAAALVGGAIEFIQIPFGRHAAWLDFVADLVGISLVVGFVLWRGYGRRAGLGLMLIPLVFLPIRLYRVPFVAAAAYHGKDIFPVIANLETGRDRWLWGGTNVEVAVVPSPRDAAAANHALRVVVDPSPHWPSVAMTRFPHDWSPYDTLLLDVRLVEGPADAQPFAVRCEDFSGRRQKQWIFNDATATHQWQTFRIPLADRPVTDDSQTEGRLFDRQDVDRLQIYLPRPDARVVLEIDNLRLE